VHAEAIGDFSPIKPQNEWRYAYSASGGHHSGFSWMEEADVAVSVQSVFQSGDTLFFSICEQFCRTSGTWYKPDSDNCRISEYEMRRINGEYYEWKDLSHADYMPSHTPFFCQRFFPDTLLTPVRIDSETGYEYLYASSAEYTDSSSGYPCFCDICGVYVQNVGMMNYSYYGGSHAHSISRESYELVSYKTNGASFSAPSLEVIPNDATPQERFQNNAFRRSRPSRNHDYVYLVNGRRTIAQSISSSSINLYFDHTSNLYAPKASICR
jgi:hypothetical protein